MQLRLAPATLDGPLVSELTDNWRAHPKATHGAILAGQASGYALTEGARANALAVIFCPARGGPVSVWPYGRVPKTAARAALRWALFAGPDCRMIAGDLAEDAEPPPPPKWPDPPQVDWIDWPMSIPPVVRDITTAVSDAYGFDPAAVSVTVLGVLSAALCSKYQVRMLTPDGEAWREAILGLYTCGIAPSGSRKTPMLEALLQPFRELANDGAAEQPRRMAAWQARVAEAQEEIAKLKAEDEIDTGALEDAYYRASEPAPREPCPIVGNGTGAALGEALSWSPQVLVATSEGSEIFRALATRDGRLDLEPLLKAYSGEAGGAVLRILRKQPAAKCYRAAVVVWTQPAVIYGLGRNPEAVEQGLLGRFLWCAQSAKPPGGSVVSAAVAKAWADLIHRARGLPGPERDPWGVETGQPNLISATPPQTQRLLDLAQEMSEVTEPGGAYYGLATWARKLHGQVARVAAILTWLADPQASIIRDECLEWALAQARGAWLPWASHVWSLLSWPPNTDDARHVWAVATRERRDTWAMQELDALMSWPPARVDAAIATLAERGFVSVSGNRMRAARVVSFARLA